MGGRGGRSQSGGGGGSAETPTPPEVATAEAIVEQPKTKSRSLPNDVTVSNFGLNRDYDTEVAGKRIAVRIFDQTFTSNAKANVDIAFGVGLGTPGNGSGLNRGALTGRDADRAAVKILKIVQHDVSTRPDGFVYKCTAHTGDGYGKKRAEAYEKFGFSKPSRVGRPQYAIVRNGKLEPFNPPSGFRPQRFNSNFEDLLSE